MLGLAVWVLLASPGHGDEVFFRNGDRLTGKIKSAADGKMLIGTVVAGDVTIDMKQVKTFMTDEAIEMHLVDGTVVKQAFVPAEEEGKVRTVGGGAAGPQTVAVTAVSKVNPPPVRWEGSLTVGAMVSRGNTETENVNARGEAIRRGKEDRITVGGGYLYGREKVKGTGERNTTADNWFAMGKYDRFLSKKLYAYGIERVERDSIAELDLRSTTSAGVGYQWWEGAKSNFLTEAGPSWLYEDYSNGGGGDHFAVRLAYRYDRKLNDKVKFIHSTEYLPSVQDFGDYNLSSEAGIRVDLTGQFFVEMKVEWRRDATPAPGTEEDDFRYLAGVGWKF